MYLWENLYYEKIFGKTLDFISTYGTIIQVVINDYTGKKMNKKTELVLKTYELLKTAGPYDIKIRTIADACNCTTTVIYRHFDDLDHLIRFASVRFLENYIVEIQSITNEKTDALEMVETLWEVFAKYAFKNIEVFDELFWGKYKEKLGDTIFEYYQMFPDEWKNLDGLFTTIFFNNDILERTYTMVRRAAMIGYFSLDDSQMLSDMECSLFHGLMLEYRDKYRLPGKAEEGAAYYMEMLYSLHEHYQIKKG